MWMLNFKQKISTDAEDSQVCLLFTIIGILPVLKLWTYSKHWLYNKAYIVNGT